MFHGVYDIFSYEQYHTLPCAIYQIAYELDHCVDVRIKEEDYVLHLELVERTSGL